MTTAAPSSASSIDWSRVDIACRSWDRLRGLIATPPNRGLLISTSSVHGFWMTRPLRVYGLDETGSVVAIDVLQPWRIVRFPNAVWILEVPLDWPQLELGSRVPRSPI